MERCILRLSLFLTIILSSFFHEAGISLCADTHADGNIILKEMKPNAIRFLKNVMEDVISEKKEPDSRFYSVFLEQKGQATMVYVTKETTHQLRESEDYLGFFTIGNDTIIVRAPDSIKVKYKKSSKKTSFQVYKNMPMTYDPDTWTYLIKPDGFARYVNGIGWLWLNRLDRFNSDNKFHLTVPKRLKNKYHVKDSI